MSLSHLTQRAPTATTAVLDVRASCRPSMSAFMQSCYRNAQRIVTHHVSTTELSLNGHASLARGEIYNKNRDKGALPGYHRRWSGLPSVHQLSFLLYASRATLQATNTCVPSIDRSPHGHFEYRLPKSAHRISIIFENLLLEARVVLRNEILGVKLLAILLVQLAHLSHAKRQPRQCSLGQLAFATVQLHPTAACTQRALGLP